MGGGSSQPKNTTTTTKTELPAWLSNDFQSFVNQTDAVNAKPYQSYQGQLNAAPTIDQTYALEIARDRATTGMPGQQAALNQILGGSQNVQAAASPYSGPNQYLDNVVNSTNQNIVDSYKRGAGVGLPTQFAQGGAFGGSAMQQAQDASQQTLAKAIADSTGNLRYQDYNAQADRWQQGFQNQLAASQNNTQNMLGASSALTGIGALQSQYLGQYAGLGQVQQDYQQGNIDQAYNDWYQRNYGYDQQRLANYGNALNSIAGNFQSTATSGLNPAYKPRTVGGAVAAGAGGAATGGAIGAAIAGGSAGSVAPGWGTAIGAAAGLASYYL